MLVANIFNNEIRYTLSLLKQKKLMTFTDLHFIVESFERKKKIKPSDRLSPVITGKKKRSTVQSEIIYLIIFFK